MRHHYSIPTVEIRRPHAALWLSGVGLILAVFTVRHLWFIIGFQHERVMTVIWLMFFLITGFQWIISWLNRPFEVNEDAQRVLDQLWVTVCIPVFNEDPQVLDRVLYSLFAQTRLPNTVEVIDDGSKVDYLEIRRWWREHHPSGVEFNWVRQSNSGKKLAQARTFANPRADIVVTLDMSGSMEETDLQPNRLEAAKAVIQDFVTRRRGDRIGLVIFGREAYTYTPLTLDHGTFLRMLAELQPGIVDGRGTAIGNGLGVAFARLRKSDAKSKVVILLTDGDNNSGNISPLQAASFAQKMGVKIYTILAGAHDSSREADDVNQPQQRYAVNPKLLEQIAGMTGGSPYLASDTRALAQRFQNILEELEKSRIRDRGALYAELYPRFLWPAFVVLLLEIALRLSRLRRLP